MSQRIKGQEVEVVVIVDGNPQDTLSAIRSASISFKTEIKQEGYLGETTDRYDEVFKGCKGDIEFHYDSPAVFDLITAIVNRARRRAPGVKVNIKMTLNFPSGRRARVTLRDVAFGDLPLSFGSRSDYGSFKLDYACSDGQVLPL